MTAVIYLSSHILPQLTRLVNGKSEPGQKPAKKQEQLLLPSVIRV